MPMSVFLVTGAVKALPLEIEESAVIDGCSPMSLYWRIVFPLTKGIHVYDRMSGSVKILE